MPGERLDQPLALVARGELDQIGDVGGMERLDQRARGGVVALVDRVEHAADELRPEPVLLVDTRSKQAGESAWEAAAMRSLSLIGAPLNSTGVAHSYGRARSGASGRGAPKSPRHRST